MLVFSRRLVVTSIIQVVHFTVAHRLFVFGRQRSFHHRKDAFAKSSFAQETYPLDLGYRISSTSVLQRVGDLVVEQRCPDATDVYKHAFRKPADYTRGF